MVSSLLRVLPLLPWAVLWVLGGIWLARAAFRLRPNEQLITGTAVGWITQTWLANILCQLMPDAAAFWVSPLVIFLAGALLVLRSDLRTLYFPVIPLQVAALGIASAVFFNISRGLAIFDDFAHLPTVSTMAAGDVPPHFPFDPQVIYGYHHLLLLFSAQMLRLGSLPPWIALDAGRTVSFVLAVALAVVWTRRLTGSALAGFAGGLMMAFASGTRWLLLFFPREAVGWLGTNLRMEGSGLQSGPGLNEALMNGWAVEGSGPLPFPFAFANGIFPPGALSAFSANGLASFVVLLVLLLTFNRWRNRLAAALLSIALVAAWGLIGEAELVIFVAGWGIVTLAYLISRRTLRLPAALFRWLVVFAAGSLVGMLEGGALTDLLIKTIERILGNPASPSYQTMGFRLAWPPAVVSSHLGVLSLFDPALIFLALLELGPVLLALPLIAIWGTKAFRAGRWYEASLAAAAMFSVLMVFVQFTGSTGVRNTPRLYVFITLCAVFAVPLAWIWVSRRRPQAKLVMSALGLITITGGMVIFGIELVASQRPMYSYFLTPLDARMNRLYWNRLDQDALVFDPVPARATALFGRFTDAAFTWYAYKPEWKALVAEPDFTALREAGYTHVYLDERYIRELGRNWEERLADPCAVVVDEFEDWQQNLRRLLDISACR